MARIPKEAADRLIALLERIQGVPGKIARILGYCFKFLNEVLKTETDRIAETDGMRNVSFGVVHPIQALRSLRRWQPKTAPLHPPATETLH